jgi:acetyl esterase/lipase
VVRAATDAASRQGPRRALPRVEDRRIPAPHGELGVRVYAPAGEGPFPGLVYFHGGGWTFCSIETHDATCRELAGPRPSRGGGGQRGRKPRRRGVADGEGSRGPALRHQLLIYPVLDGGCDTESYRENAEDAVRDLRAAFA